METEIPLGKVTAELVLAEIEKTSEAARNGIANNKGMYVDESEKEKPRKTGPLIIIFCTGRNNVLP